MKPIALCILAALILLSGCGKSGGTVSSEFSTEAPTNSGGTASVEILNDSEPFERQTGDVVEITEKLFIAQTNDIYLNADDYVGKTIKYQGLYKRYEWLPADSTEPDIYHYVLRYGPGCCGDDGDAGFEVVWDGEWPEQEDWVEAVGVLEVYEYNGWPFLQIRLESLQVLDQRGAEYVYQ